MDDDTLLPPRKKSRFFANGRSTIDPPSEESNGKSGEEARGLAAQPGIGESSRSVRCGTDNGDVLRDQDRGPTGHMLEWALPVRSTKNLDNSYIEGSTSHINKRHAIYGAQNFGTHSSFLQTSSSNSAKRPQEQYQNTSGAALDVDRDEFGTLIPFHLRQNKSQLNTSQAYHNSPLIRRTPPNFYTSPKRLEKTIAISSWTLKRKASDPNPAPAAYVFTRSNDPDFNVFANGILLYPELCFALAMQLTLRDLVSLYSISRDFHTIVDSRFTTICLAQALNKAPHSAQAFRFRSYAEFCRTDPAARLPHPDPVKAAQGIRRKIPSFRWVAFVMHREKVVHELVTVFAEKGCPLPVRCKLALTRMWMLFDVPDNARRIAMIHNHRLFTELDLYFLMCFFIKLDMVLNDPIAPEQRNGLRKLLLSQRGGLDIMLKVLKQEMWQQQSDVIIAWVKTTLNLEDLTQEEMNEMNVQSVFGVPTGEVGRGKYEYWGLKGVHNDVTGEKRQYLLRPDQLVLREAIRRGMRLSPHYARYLLYGYIRPDTLESYEPRKYGRRIEGWEDGEYDINSSFGGLRALAIEDGGDPLLDLGNKSRGSKHTIEKDVSNLERGLREQQSRYLSDLYEISEKERLQKFSED